MREEIVDPRLGGDRRRRHRVVAGDHHGADAHLAQGREALADAALDDVLQMDRAEQAAVFGDGERGAARMSNALGDCLQFARGGILAHRDYHVAARRRGGPTAVYIGQYRIDRTLANRGTLTIDAADPGLRRKRDEMGVELRHIAATDAVFVLREHDDRSTFGRLVGKRSELRRIGQLLLGDAGERDELGCLPVAQRDRAGLVEQQRVDVARRLDRPARHRQHVEAYQAVHAGDADRR